MEAYVRKKGEFSLFLVCFMEVRYLPALIYRLFGEFLKKSLPNV